MLEKTAVCCCRMERPVAVRQVQLEFSAVQVRCFLTDLRLVFVPLVEPGALASPASAVALSFSLLSVSLCIAHLGAMSLGGTFDCQALGL